MAIPLRTPDIYAIVVLTGVLSSCALCRLETQNRQGYQQQSSELQTEAETLGPSAPVLSQMDYEILGTSGFSITDVTQNTNFSDVSKITRSNALDKKEQQHITKSPLYNSRQKVGVNISLAATNHIPNSSSNTEGKLKTKSAFTASGVNITSKKAENLTATEDLSTNSALSKVSQRSPYTQKLETPIGVTSILKFVGLRPTENSLPSKKLAHRNPLPSSTSPTYTSPRTLKTNFHDNMIKFPERNETMDQALTTENLNTASDLANSAAQLTFTNESSYFDSKNNNDSSPNLEEGSEILHSVSDTTISEVTNAIVNHSSLADKYEPAIQRSQTSPMKQTVASYSSLTTEPYSPVTHHEDINTTILSTTNNAEPEYTTWTTAGVSLWGSEDDVLVDSVSPSTDFPDLMNESSPANKETSSTLISNVDYKTTPTQAVSSSTTKSSHVTSRVPPTTVTTEVIPTQTTPVLTEKPQLLVNMSGQIRIIRGMIWMYQLNDKMSAEFQYYSRKVQRMLEEMFWQTWLAKHIKKIDVHRFRRGSVMVDFRLVVKTERHILPQEMEVLFNSFLLPDGGFGGFQMDRHYTKFQIFEPVVTVAAPLSVENNNLPQWATALIVISGASLVFVVLFGIVTVYGTSPFFSSKNHQRLKDDESRRCSNRPKVECTEWERKVAAAYENLSADGIYDLDEVGANRIKATDGYRRKLENTEA